MTKEEAKIFLLQLHTDKQLNKSEHEALRVAIKALEKEPGKGHWIDHSDEGYVKCPICGSATNCDGNIADLHFCFSCGAKMDE